MRSVTRATASVLARALLAGALAACVFDSGGYTGGGRRGEVPPPSADFDAAPGDEGPAEPEPDPTDDAAAPVDASAG